MLKDESVGWGGIVSTGPEEEDGVSAGVDVDGEGVEGWSLLSQLLGNKPDKAIPVPLFFRSRYGL